METVNFNGKHFDWRGLFVQFSSLSNRIKLISQSHLVTIVFKINNEKAAEFIMKIHSRNDIESVVGDFLCFFKCLQWPFKLPLTQEYIWLKSILFRIRP